MAAPRHHQHARLQQMEAHRPGPVRALAAVCLAGVLLLACPAGGEFPQAHAQAKEQPIRVSLPDLLANKLSYKDKLVRIPGFVVVARENHSLFVNEDEADTLNGDPKTGLWLRLDSAQHERYRRFSGKYGQVTGRFRTSDCEGHMCAFGGSLDEVTIRSH
jgi:hypothetical protein